MTPIRLLTVLLTIAALAGCVWVQPEPGSYRIRLVERHQVHHCERLGETTVSVRDRVAGVQRSPSTIEEELLTLARNSAYELGGNRLVDEGRMGPGKGRYGIYRCEAD
ncbi:DUF4156 domain-containing protein [Wenzhouxiangella marina]|uniref:Uncharacterized protein n=1 Tax=Wenzhouxiangella marina TaxID=1579979 RepID=A0A0K0XY65_9GAMM|nr:DUF4156 domain-containing protein [Wenzhouxiangella marina]AKS42566.1 hypothetical protein WM2015_2203 [Wenzhouxiangella marina]MBB6085652.1 hypothetical protein [Wenzhouxiangella marina]